MLSRVHVAHSNIQVSLMMKIGFVTSKQLADSFKRFIAVWFNFRNNIFIIIFTTKIIKLSYLLHTLKCTTVVAFFFSNLTLKGVNLQNFGGVFFFQIWHLRVLTCKNLVALFFSNLTLKGVNLQKFGGVFFFQIWHLRVLRFPSLIVIFFKDYLGRNCWKWLFKQHFGGVYFFKFDT